MKFVPIIFLVFFALNGFTQQNDTSHVNVEEIQIIGECDRQQLEEGEFGEIFRKEFDNYQTDISALLDKMELLHEIDIVIVLGTWCGDSKREVPRFFKIMDELGYENERYKILCVDRKKMAGDINVYDKYMVQLVPTFIFYKEGEEIGRIIETPEETLENDIYNILENIK